ncbi:phage integrase SAM-like domain-containing protein [uncultured Spirosoma sp.]|uniref:tyrosine-type recombinase/integrase n=1 Tax=uncultured Spirosoma sp. TaxID=278208 RepID=UPI0025895996|nr:phage integrase SAM-like domain-containing protein [uncultured Spirosoma sp.]
MSEDKLKQTRKRKEFSLKFRVRSYQKNSSQPVNLQIRLTIDGVTTGDYSADVFVLPSKWDHIAQQATGRDSETTTANEMLVGIRNRHHEIYREIKWLSGRGQSPRPTASRVKECFLNPKRISPSLDMWYTEYLNYLDSLTGLEDGKAEKTITRAYKTRDYIREFSGTNPKPGSTDKSPQLIDLTVGWAKRFHVWLQTDPVTGKHRMKKDSANKHLSHLRDALDYAIEESRLSLNPLDKFRPTRGKLNPVYYLEPKHLEKLAELSFEGAASDHLWWCRLMCYTGLDYKDAVRYAANREDFEQNTPFGVKVVIQRQKPPHNVCEFPLLPEVIALFEQHPTGPARQSIIPRKRCVNRVELERAVVSNFMRDMIGPAVGFPHPFTSKIARKTAGAHFLRLGYSMEGVSKFLGHSRTTTTQEHYVNVSSSYVDAEMRRVREQTLGDGPVMERIVRLPPPILKTA